MSRRVGFDHRDPMLRPFIEVEAKIALDVLDDLRTERVAAREVVRELATMVHRDAMEGAENLVAKLSIDNDKHLPVIACAEGCAHCCYGTVYASAIEVLHLAAWLKESGLPITNGAKERGRAIAELETMDARAKAKIACPVLDERTGRCSAYEARPVACRAYHSGSVEACRRAFDAGDANPVLPVVGPLFNVAHAHAFGMMTAMMTESLDVGPYDLAAALPRALEEDSLEERWLAGEKVFEHTTISREAATGYEFVLRELADDLRDGRLHAAEAIARVMDPNARRRERNRKKRERKSLKSR